MTAPLAPKKRNTRSWKTEAQHRQEVADDLQKRIFDVMKERDASRVEVHMWQNTNTFNYRLFLATGAVASAELLVICYLVFWHYKP